MSKFKEFFKKVANKFSTPVKPLASEVFEEDKFKIDVQGNVKASKIKISENGIQITSDNGIKLNMGIPNLPVKPEMIETVENGKSKVDLDDNNSKSSKPLVKWYNSTHHEPEKWYYGAVEGIPHNEAQFFVWSNKKDDVVNRLYKIKDRTKSKRIKNKVQKQIDAYKQQRLEKDVLVTGEEYTFRYWSNNGESDGK
ncbi:hypothetical protein NST33_18145 [Paenibacillus sp. FSL L8-0435]|uniref:hypothetical protein n=1 Tax=Paenibacillus sp. FSL L8-0435 TaxID=2954618 RepID=UPI0030D9E593